MLQPARIIRPRAVTTSLLSKYDCQNWDVKSNPYNRRKMRKFIYSSFAAHSPENLLVTNRIQRATALAVQKGGSPSIKQDFSKESQKLTYSLISEKQKKTKEVAALKVDPQRLPAEPVPYNYGVSKRLGLIGFKQGMATYFDERTGKCLPATILHIDTNVTLWSHWNPTQDPSLAIQQVGAGIRENPNNATSVELAPFLKCGVNVGRLTHSFEVSRDALLPPGVCLSASHFVPGQLVDVHALSKGKGFQGVMKRWGFSGMPATHGCSKSHRKQGSVGTSHTMSRVLKGKKMPGRMGFKKRVAHRLQVLKVDLQYNSIWLKGSVPGAYMRPIKIVDSSHNPLLKTLQPPFPTSLGPPPSTLELYPSSIPPVPPKTANPDRFIVK